MTQPAYSDPLTQLWHGAAQDVLPTLPAESVSVCVTSPPYYGGIRKYRGLDDTQLGLEATPEEYVDKLVEIFRLIRRLLRSDGVFFCNAGDTMPDGELLGIPQRLALALQQDGWRWRSEIVWAKTSAMPESVSGTFWEQCKVRTIKGLVNRKGDPGKTGHTAWSEFAPSDYSKPDALAQWADCAGCPKCSPNDGLVLRQGQWRPTRSHEALLMFTKTDRPWLDGEAVKHEGANIRDVWPLGPEPHTEAMCPGCHAYYQQTPERCRCGHSGDWIRHYAAFPTTLPTRCIQVGTSEKGHCPECGTGWARVVEKPKVGTYHDHSAVGVEYGKRMGGGGPSSEYETARTLSWRAACNCRSEAPLVPGVVLDPFAGTSTSLAAARSLGRIGWGIELAEDYVAYSVARLQQAQPAMAGI